MKLVELSINNHIVDAIHKQHITQHVMERTSAPNERVLRTTQLAKLSFNHPSVVLTGDVFQYFYKMKYPCFSVDYCSVPTQMKDPCWSVDSCRQYSCTVSWWKTTIFIHFIKCIDHSVQTPPTSRRRTLYMYDAAVLLYIAAGGSSCYNCCIASLLLF